MTDMALKLIAAIVQSKDLSVFQQLGDMEHLFEYDDHSAMRYKLLREHVYKFGAIPSREVFESATGETLPVAEDTPAYYVEEVRKNWIQKNITVVGEQVRERLQVKDPIGALTLLTEAVNMLNSKSVETSVHDFRNIEMDVWPGLVSRWKGAANHVTLGWPYLDDMAGSVGAGDLVSIVGRPGQGKTFALLCIALHIWRDLRLPVLFVSMEMKVERIFGRLSAMYTATPMDWVNFGTFPNFAGLDAKGEFKGRLFKAEGEKASFFVVDGTQATTVADIVALTQRLGPLAVFVDGAYLLCLPGQSDRYHRVAENCRLLKADLATGCAVPTFCSWQFNREAAKGNKAKNPGLELIAHSDEIGQLSTLVLAFLEAENGAKGGQRKIHILKGREGQQGEFRIAWDFENMDFSEIKKPYAHEGLNLF